MLVGETGCFRKLVSTVTSTYEGLNDCATSFLQWPWLANPSLSCGGLGCRSFSCRYFLLMAGFCLGEESQGLTGAWIPIWRWRCIPPLSLNPLNPLDHYSVFNLWAHTNTHVRTHTQTHTHTHAHMNYNKSTFEICTLTDGWWPERAHFQPNWRETWNKKGWTAGHPGGYHPSCCTEVRVWSCRSSKCIHRWMSFFPSSAESVNKNRKGATVDKKNKALQSKLWKDELLKEAWESY